MRLRRLPVGNKLVVFPVGENFDACPDIPLLQTHVERKFTMNSKQKQAKKTQLIGIHGSYCWHCKCRFHAEDLTLDHLVPKSKGGSNALGNLWLACFPCNNSRGNNFYPPARSFGHLRQSSVNVARKNAQAFDV